MKPYMIKNFGKAILTLYTSDPPTNERTFFISPGDNAHIRLTDEEVKFIQNKKKYPSIYVKLEG